MREKKKHCYCV